MLSFVKKLKVMITILLLGDMVLSKKHWLILDWLQRSLEVHMLMCMRII